MTFIYKSSTRYNLIFINTMKIQFISDVHLEYLEEYNFYNILEVDEEINCIC